MSLCMFTELVMWLLKNLLSLNWSKTELLWCVDKICVKVGICEALPEGGPMSPVWILKRLVSVFINACRLLSALPSLLQFGWGRLSLVAISFYALFGPCRLLEFTLAGPHMLIGFCLLYFVARNILGQRIDLALRKLVCNIKNWINKWMMMYKDLKNTTFLCFRIRYADRRGKAKNFQVHECCTRLSDWFNFVGI